ncbi:MULTISPECIES: helix-turn-helix domain-containing protein [unclassified Acidiphilium]|uniref:helix-turn-helix domain-containing protein n=1 Tax=unclassified Acidiphilium TaxID=2617493 RepID=UPI00257F8E0B|nr:MULTISPECIES: helix-turn-helix domain-containing protein [unclassified Acidiphilium]
MAQFSGGAISEIICGHLKKGAPDMPTSSHPDFVSIQVWAGRTGISRSKTYELLASGDLKARKIGRRTLIDFQHGLSWIENQPLAKIAPPFQRNHLSEVA